MLKDDLSFMGESNKVIFIYDPSPQLRPCYTMYFLSGSSEPEEPMEVLTREQFGMEDIGWREQSLTFRDKTYRVRNAPRASLDFIYADTPMLDMIYDYLESKINKLEVEQ